MRSSLDYYVGLDVGSTTAKAVLTDEKNNILFKEYCRHNTKIYDTVNNIFGKIKERTKNSPLKVTITGSAGMGISENLHIPFIQEVISATELTAKLYPELNTLIDIGGEDSKMIFFSKERPPDIRMNGSCAGGTGAFIDQMASLMNISTSELNEAAKKSKKIHPIASRCGVFAKTDLQNLLARKISVPDIAASVFHAVVVQTINTLARGYELNGNVMCIGGPFKFLSELKKTFIKVLKIGEENVITPEFSELIPAMGAALNSQKEKVYFTAEKIISALKERSKKTIKLSNRLSPLFKDNKELKKWNENRIKNNIKIISIDKYEGKNCFLGIDSGSTTTKITLIGENSELLFSFYKNNSGAAVDTVKEGLEQIAEQINKSGKDIEINKTAVTGYGEDLIKAAFNLDMSMVETIAHFTAAKHFNPKVSFIMDIGGQDMKAIFIKNDSIYRIDLNEACSAGCGSFIQTFGKSMGYEIGNFAQLACKAKAPTDLGTRCTVFMNSKVKQSLKENAAVEDISAGLSISVIKNALFKVLKINDPSILGDNIVVQGGTFKNPSVVRALEQLSQKKVICSNIPEMMGAYGAALSAKQDFEKKRKLNKKQKVFDINITNRDKYKSNEINCKGCYNFCNISCFQFSNGNKFYSGNKCENFFTNKGISTYKGVNLYEEKYKLLFKRKPFAPQKILKEKINIGIPRVLNMYENYPFWHALFTASGLELTLSGESTNSIYEKGKGTIMSDSICFPAKLTHGHIKSLVEQKVDRIFMPIVIYESNEYSKAENSFNCPIVSSYADVIDSSMDTSGKHRIPLDKPIINFKDKKLLKKGCWEYLKKFNISRQSFLRAFNIALNETEEYKKIIREKGEKLINEIKENNKNNKDKRIAVVLCGRPYHADPLINHKIPAILSSLGVDVITDDALPETESDLDQLKVIPQWAYPNRIYKAALWVSRQNKYFQLIQFNSFGCGPDAIVTDEVSDILKTANKNLTILRIDDITSTGSVKLRLRSMIESIRAADKNYMIKSKERITTKTFEKEDAQRTILAPYFADMYSCYLEGLFEAGGYKLETLPPPDKKSVEQGLRFSNNEICYPATVIVGDMIKALKSGKYDLNKTAIGITQTGGQCRATTYLSLIKKGLIASGFENVPVIAVGTSGKTLNPQPGFNMNWRKLITTAVAANMFADALAKMYYATVVREKEKGDCKKLVDKYQKKAVALVGKRQVNGLYELLQMAVDEFNEVKIYNKNYPQIGVVGEIYVKYNSFGHGHIVDWLIDKGIEVVVPPLIDFFIQEFVNYELNIRNRLIRPSVNQLIVYLLENKVNKQVERTEKILNRFRFTRPFHKIRDLSKKAEKILSMANQFGEGWLIPAEIAAFAEDNINNVISLQPFGCIANHIVSKGVEKKMRKLYPKMNLLFLDFDDGTTEVNILNRLHFMIKNV